MISYRFKLHSKAKKDGYLGDKITKHLLLYNIIVDLGEKYYKKYGRILRSKTLNKYVQMKKHDPSWNHILDGLNAWAIQDTIRRRDEAFDRYFKYLRKKKTNPYVLPKESPPQKHKIHGEGSYKLTKGSGWRLKEDGIDIGVLWNHLGKKKDIHHYRFLGNRKIEGNIKNAVLKRDWYGDIWCSITTDHTESIPLQKTGKIGGFDYSQQHFFVGDDGRYWDIPCVLEEKMGELRRETKILKQKTEGSGNRRRQRRKVSKLFRKITRIRRDLHYKLAWKLCREYDVMCFEDNDYAEMRQKGRKVNGHWVSKKQRVRCLALSPKSFLVILQEVANKTGKQVWFAPRNFASSQICNVCGKKYPTLRNLKIRKWKCRQCGAEHDRDVNAAKNLVKEHESTVGGVPSIEANTNMKNKGSTYWSQIRKSASLKRAASLVEKSTCSRKDEPSDSTMKSEAVQKHPELYSDAIHIVQHVDRNDNEDGNNESELKDTG